MDKKESLDPVYFRLFEPKLGKGELKKFEIIREVVESIAEEGIDQINFGSIAKRLKIRRSHVAYYFESQEEMIFLAVRYALEKGYEIVVSHLSEAKTPKQRIRKWVEGNFDWMTRNRKLLGCTFMLFYYYASHNPTYRRLNEQVKEASAKRAIALLKEALPTEDPQIEKKSLLIQSVINGLGIYLITTENRPTKESVRESIDVAIFGIEQILDIK